MQLNSHACGMVCRALQLVATADDMLFKFDTEFTANDLKTAVDANTEGLEKALDEVAAAKTQMSNDLSQVQQHQAPCLCAHQRAAALWNLASVAGAHAPRAARRSTFVHARVAREVDTRARARTLGARRPLPTPSSSPRHTPTSWAPR